MKREELDLGFTTDEFTDDEDESVASHESSVTRDGDTRLTAEEIEHASNAVLAREALQRYDMDGDGYLSAKELRKLVRHLPLELNHGEAFKYTKPVSTTALVKLLSKAEVVEAFRKLLVAPPIGTMCVIHDYKGNPDLNGRRACAKKVMKDGLVQLSMAGGTRQTVPPSALIWDEEHDEDASF